jgi:hypothetical protein
MPGAAPGITFCANASQRTQVSANFLAREFEAAFMAGASPGHDNDNGNDAPLPAKS